MGYYTQIFRKIVKILNIALIPLNKIMFFWNFTEKEEAHDVTLNGVELAASDTSETVTLIIEPADGNPSDPCQGSDEISSEPTWQGSDEISCEPCSGFR